MIQRVLDEIQSISHDKNKPLTQALTHLRVSAGLIFFLGGATVPSGARGGAVGRGTALQAGWSRVRFQMASLEFFINIILPAAIWDCG